MAGGGGMESKPWGKGIKRQERRSEVSWGADRRGPGDRVAGRGGGGRVGKKVVRSTNRVLLFDPLPPSSLLSVFPRFYGFVFPSFLSLFISCIFFFH